MNIEQNTITTVKNLALIAHNADQYGEYIVADVIDKALMRFAQAPVTTQSLPAQVATLTQALSQLTQQSNSQFAQMQQTINQLREQQTKLMQSENASEFSSPATQTPQQQPASNAAVLGIPGIQAAGTNTINVPPGTNNLNINAEDANSDVGITL